MARKLGTSVRNSDVLKLRSAKFEPGTIQTRSKTMQNLAHLQKTETTRMICTRSKTLENKPVTQKTKAILAKTRETKPIPEYRRITRFRFVGTQQKASQNQVMGRKIADVPPIRTSAPVKPSKSIPLPKKKDQASGSTRSSFQKLATRSSFQKLAKSEAVRKVGANTIKAHAVAVEAHAVAVETRKQTASVKVQHNPLPSKESSINGSYQSMLGGNPKNKDPVEVPCRSVMEPSSKSESHTVAGCSTSVLHRKSCYDKVQRERIRRAHMKNHRSMPKGACSTPVKQTIPYSDDICPAAPRKGKSRSGLDVRRVSSSVCRKVVFDKDVSKELLERVLDNTKRKVSDSEKSFQEEPVTIRHGHRQQETQEESSIEFSTPEKQIVSYDSYRGKACPPAPIKAKSTSYFDGRPGSSCVCRKLVFDEDVSSSAPIEGKSMSCFDGETLSYSLSKKVMFDEDLEADAPPAFKNTRKVPHETETLSFSFGDGGYLLSHERESKDHAVEYIEDSSAFHKEPTETKLMKKTDGLRSSMLPNAPKKKNSKKSELFLLR